MFCPNCGKELNEADKFCSACGKSLKGNKKEILIGTPSANTKNVKVIAICVLGIVALITIMVLFVRVGEMQDSLDTMVRQQAQENDIKEIQRLVTAVFNERNEELDNLCLDNVCDQALSSLVDYLANRAKIDSKDINSSELEKFILNNFMAYFENSENCNKVVNAITDCTVVTCDDIEINGDEASAYVYINYVNVYDVDYSVWEDMLSDTSIIGYVAGGWVDLGLQALDMIFKGDLSIYLDEFTDKCESSGSIRTYADEVGLVKNEDGEWEIVDFPNDLFYAYYGISME